MRLIAKIKKALGLVPAPVCSSPFFRSTVMVWVSGIDDEGVRRRISDVSHLSMEIEHSDLMNMKISFDHDFSGMINLEGMKPLVEVWDHMNNKLVTFPVDHLRLHPGNAVTLRRSSTATIKSSNV